MNLTSGSPAKKLKKTPRPFRSVRRDAAEKEERIQIYTERYDVLLEALGLNNATGGYSKLTVEDKFRVFCCQEVWSRTRCAEVDRLLQFAKAVWATSDDHLRLDDPVMAKAFERYKADPRGHRPTRNLTSGYRNRKNYRGLPCVRCGERLRAYKYKTCIRCRAIIRNQK